MLSALALALTLSALPAQDLPTMKQVRQGMHEDMRKLKGYSDEWRLVTKEDQPGKITFRRYIDDARNQMAVIVDEKVMLESGFDGKNAWMIFHPGRLYADETFEAKNAKATFEPPADAEDGTFSFTFNGAYDFDVWSKPDLQVTSLEKVKLGDKDLRKVTATAKKETGKMQVEMWFDLDRWRMQKARCYGGKVGEELDVTLEMVKSSFTEKYDTNSFVLEQAKVSGYEKKTLDEMKKLGGG